MKEIGWLLVLLHLALINISLANRDSISMVKTYIELREGLINIRARMDVGQEIPKDKFQEPVPDRIPFPCSLNNTRSVKRPTSVHKLRPGDIDVVGAMGDSLTAASGAGGTDILHILMDYRGMSWTIGGQGTWRKYLTLPNILKEFNPNLIGYSLGNSLSHQRASQFNVGVFGAVSEDLPFMTKELVRRIKSDKRVNVKNDWKLITVFMGANNMCSSFCYQREKEFQKSHERHRQDLITSFDYLRNHLPRTLVNYIIIPDFQILRTLKNMPPQCGIYHLIECPCLFGLPNQRIIKRSMSMIKKWQQVEREVANDIRYQKDDFAIVLQPFTANIRIPYKLVNGREVTDLTFLSGDCFHLSQKGNARVANGLWNNMLEPINRKTHGWTDTFTRFLCPTKDSPYIYTLGNSFSNSTNFNKSE